MASAHVSIQLEARGPNTTVMTGWAAGLSAIIEGAAWIAEGSAVAVLAGGADSAVHPFAFAAFEQAGLFAGPSPLVPAEGAAVVLLEEREAALARGARILGEVGDHALAAGPRLSALVAAAAPAPAGLLERLAGNLLAAHAPAALVLALAEGLSSPVAAVAARTGRGGLGNSDGAARRGGLEHRMSPSRAEVEARVLSIVADALDQPAENVTLDSSLVDDLGAESIDFLDIVFRLESAFGLKIPEEEIWAGSFDGVGTDPDAIAARLAELKIRRPAFRWDRVPARPTRADLPRLITVGTVVEYLEKRLEGGAEPSE